MVDIIVHSFELDIFEIPTRMDESRAVWQYREKKERSERYVERTGICFAHEKNLRVFPSRMDGLYIIISLSRPCVFFSLRNNSRVAEWPKLRVAPRGLEIRRAFRRMRAAPTRLPLIIHRQTYISWRQLESSVYSRGICGLVSIWCIETNRRLPISPAYCCCP